MKFKNLIFIALLPLSLTIAEEPVTKEKKPKGWTNEAIGSLNFSNSRYDNWAAGGEDAMTWSLKLNGSAERDYEHFNWKSTGKLEYGKSKVSGASFRKSADEIFLETVFSYKWTEVLNPYTAASFQSQFTSSYEYDDENDTKTEISKFWNPAYLTQSAGLGYKPMENLLTRLGFSLKETFADEFPFADDPDTEKFEKSKIEPGLESITEFKTKFNDILKYSTKFNMFINFKGVKEIDTKWENNFSAQVAKYLVVNFTFEMLYDLDQDESRQIKQVLSAGLNYTLF